MDVAMQGNKCKSMEQIHIGLDGIESSAVCCCKNH